MTAIVPYSDSNQQPSVFRFNGHDITVRLDSQGNPWFDGPQVCKAVSIGNPSDAYARLDDDEKSTLAQIDPESRYSGSPRVYVNESGLYNLILRSDKPEAKAFKKVVTSEILPAIRKTGSYSIVPKNLAELSLLHAQALVNHENRLQALEARVNAADEWAKHFSIIGYCNLKKLPAPTHNEAISLGHKAGKLSRDQGYKMGKTSDPRFGEINTYHIDILVQVFGK